MAKDQANAKQHPEAELLLFKSYWHSSFTLSSKIIGYSKKQNNILKNKQKNKCVWINEIIRLIVIENENENKPSY